MGQTTSNIAKTVGSGVSTIGRTLGSPARNLANFKPREHNIYEFYPEIGKRLDVGNEMFDRINPSVRSKNNILKFTDVTLFQPIDDINNDLRNYSVNDNRYNRLKTNLSKLNKTQELFNTESINFDPIPEPYNNDLIFKMLTSVSNNFYSIIDYTLEEKSSEIKTKFVSENEENFKTYIDTLKQQFTVIDYFAMIIKYFEILKKKVEFEIKFYKGDSNLTAYQKLERNKGWFSAITRSGFNYAETAKFLEYYLNQKVKISLNRVKAIKERYEQGCKQFNEIFRDWSYLSYPIKSGFTDELVIHTNNANNSIFIGNNQMVSLNSLCQKIQEKINQSPLNNFTVNLVLSGDNLSTQYNIEGPRFLFLSSVGEFKIKPESTMFKYIGFRQSSLYESNYNQTTQRHFISSESLLPDENELSDTRNDEETESIKLISGYLTSYCTKMYRASLIVNN